MTGVEARVGTRNLRGSLEAECQHSGIDILEHWKASRYCAVDFRATVQSDTVLGLDIEELRFKLEDSPCERRVLTDHTTFKLLISKMSSRS